MVRPTIDRAPGPRAAFQTSRRAAPRSPMRRAAGAAVLGAALLLAACDSAEERKQSHLDSGLALMEQGEAQKAFLEFTNAVRIDDGFLPAHAALGRLHMREGRHGAAVPHLLRVAEAEPENVEAQLDLAEAFLELREPEGVLRHAEAALARDGDDPRALALFAGAVLLQGDVDAARARAARALELDPAQPLARLVAVAERLRAGEPEAALALLDAAPDTGSGAGSDTGPDTGSDMGFELVRIQILERMGDRQGVGAALLRLAEALPADEGLRLALVRWHMQADPPDLDAAEAELRALADASGAPNARLRVVDFLAQARSVQAAREELEALIAGAESEAEGAAEAGLYGRALARVELALGEREAALARLEAMAETDEGGEAGDAARLMLARALDPQDPGTPARRAALIEEVLERDGGNVEALALRAELALMEDRPSDAILDLRAALDAAPRRPALLELLARAHEREGDDALAAEQRAVAVQATGAAPGPSLRYAEQLARMGRLDSAEAVLIDALRAGAEDRALLTALAELRLRRQDWDGVLEVTRAIERLDAEGPAAALPQAFSSDLLRAAALFGEGRVEETLEMLRANWRDRGTPADLEAMVRAMAASGRGEEARAALDAALAEDAGNLAALGLLAQLQAGGGDVAGAEATLRDGLARRPEASQLSRLLSELLSSQGRFEDAAAVLEAGLEAAPEDPGLRFDKALRLETLGEAERAIALYERLYDEDPDNIVVANNLAAMLSDHRDDAESLARAAQVARRLRGSPIAAFQDTYGWTLYLTGETSQAVAVLRESAPRLPNNAIAQFHLGMAYAAIGQAAPARERLARALELAEAGALLPARAEAEETLARMQARLDADAAAEAAPAAQDG